MQSPPNDAAPPPDAAPQAMRAHYGDINLVDRLLSAIRDAGGDPDRLSPADLYPYDQLHARGLAATREHIALLQPVAGQRYLDLGSGIGGPARYLAVTHQATVVGIDLSLEFVAAEQRLTRLCGLSDRVSSQRGDALRLPFAAAGFDGALCLHLAMNVQDQAGLAREIHRVLKPGARLVWSQPVVLAGAAPPTYPLPWARDATTSFLPDAAHLREIIEDAGFAIERLEDDTPKMRAIFAAPSTGGPARSAGTVVVMGDDLPEARRSFGENIRAGRIGCVVFSALRA